MKLIEFYDVLHTTFGADLNWKPSGNDLNLVHEMINLQVSSLLKTFQ